MIKRIFLCAFMLFSFSVSAANGGNGSDGGSANNTPGRSGCPGGTAPDKAGKFYLPGTHEQCNPGKQDALRAR